MRQLEVVAVSDDGGYVLLAGDENASRASHAVRIDNRLQAAVRGELGDSDERRESELSPRDIQARLRAGETTEAVAKAAKVPVARVMRYAGPVLSERERIVEQAQGALLQRSRGPAASTPLGEAVEKRLAATAGLRPETVTWDARRRDDGAWVVVLNYSARGARSALWLWQPAQRELTSLNTLATRLGADDSTAAPRRSTPRRTAAKPAARRRASTSRRRAAKRAATGSRAAKRTTATRTTKQAATSRSKTTASQSARRTAAVGTRRASKPATKRAGSARTTTATRTTARATSATKAPAKRVTGAANSAARRAASRPPAKKAPVRQRAPRVNEPPVIEPPARRKNGRVELPSWSDVLLGVQAPPARGRRRS